MNSEVLLRIKAVKEKTGLKHATLYKLIGEGKFPKPIKITERCSAWLLSEGEMFIQNRIAASRAGSSDGARKLDLNDETPQALEKLRG